MPVIHLSTFINAPAERCFDLSRSIEVHQESTAATNERAVAGVTSGLMKLGDSVTWKAKHLGVTQSLSSVITDFKYPERFTDDMVKGVFNKIHHRHIFSSQDGGTLMTDIFEFQAPLGILGRFAEWLFLTRYLRRFIMERNAHIKKLAEGEGWKKYLKM